MQTKTLKKYIEDSAVRFRRYSRKSYAVFASLGKNVTIGTLASYIADKSNVVNSEMTEERCNNTEYFDVDNDDSIADIVEIIDINILTTAVTATPVAAAAYADAKSYILSTIYTWRADFLYLLRNLLSAFICLSQLRVDSSIFRFRFGYLPIIFRLSSDYLPMLELRK